MGKEKLDTFGGNQTPSRKKRAALGINPESITASRPRCRRIDIKTLKFDKNGLIPAIIQDYKTGEVLMLAYMNLESLRRTLKSGKTCFWSRSRKEYWIKGATSGHFQFVKSLAYDCDLDTLLVRVRQVGAACHTGNRSCFYRRLK